MKNLEVYFLDLQTTGSKPESGNILEMAFAKTGSEVQSFLVKQPLDVSIPRRIQLVTGVKDSDMQEAVSFVDSMTRLKSYIPPESICVIHYAQFEKPFLHSAFSTLGEKLHFEILCTHEIAKRLYPNLPSRGIKALAGFFGHDSGEFKRSRSHVEATQTIWKKLTEELYDLQINNVETLHEWLQKTPKAKKTKYEYPLAKEKRLSLPDEPGIYRMKNADGKVLYVGKATSLHDRVNSYFRGQKKRDPFKLEMLTMVVDIEVTVCPTPLHSALMETDEIKRLNPYYNIALKEKNRSLIFFSHDFNSMASICDDVHCIGPFSSIAVLESMLVLHQWLNSESELPPENMFYEELAPELIKEGFDIFCIRHEIQPSAFKNFRSLIAVGLTGHRRLLKLLGQLEEEQLLAENENETNSVDDEELTSEEIADKFERHFIRVAAAYIRSKKLSNLLDADIEWDDGIKSNGQIVIRNGIVEKLKISSRSTNNSWSGHGIETYDRMTVLLAELDKIKSKNGLVKIR